MVLIKIKKRDLVCFASKALSEDMYFRVMYLENEWYGMTIQEDKLHLLIKEWPNRAADFFSNETEVEFITPLGGIFISIHSEIKGFAHNFTNKLKRKYEQKQNWKAFSYGKAKNLSRYNRRSLKAHKTR